MEASEPDRTQVSTTPSGRGSFWGSVARIGALLAIGTIGFYVLGQMSRRVEELDRQAQTPTAAEGVASRGAAGGSAAPERTGPLPQLPSLSPYPAATSAIDGDTFLVNGVPRRLQMFATGDRPDRVVAWYVSEWKRAGLKGTQQGDDKMCCGSALDPTHCLQYSVMATWDPSTGTSFGNASISALRRFDPGWKMATLPLPKGTLPVMDMQSNDSGSAGNMAGYIVPLSVRKTREHLVHAMPESGWRYERNYTQNQQGGDAGVLFFSQGERLLTVNVDPVGPEQTSLIVNESSDLK